MPHSMFIAIFGQFFYDIACLVAMVEDGSGPQSSSFDLTSIKNVICFVIFRCTF